MTVQAFAMALVLRQLALTDVAGPMGIDVPGIKFGGAGFTDLDGDGCVDAVVNTQDASVFSRLLLGACDAGFTDATAQRAPGLIAAVIHERSVVLGDLDGDGWPELARNSTTRIELFRHGGPGAMNIYSPLPQLVLQDPPDAGATDFLNCEGLGFADVNGDGWLDLIHEASGIDLRLNPADGGLQLQREFDAGLPILAWAGDFTATADVDVDGWPDFLVRSDRLGQLWFNDRGAFTPSASFREESFNNDKGAVAVCDFDSDGRFDIFWSDNGWRPNEVWLQAQPRVFSSAGTPGGGAREVNGAACGDVDGDGDPDLVLSRTAETEVWRGTGGGAFVRDTVDVRGGQGAVMVDYDRDGDLDVFVNGEPRASLYRNDAPRREALWVGVKTDRSGALRDELGASAHVETCAGVRLSGERELSGGQGRGTQTEPMMHFALARGVDVAVVVSVLHPGGARTKRAVLPSSLASRRRELIIGPGPDDLAACGDLDVEHGAACGEVFSYQPMLAGAMSGTRWWLSGVDGESLPGGITVSPTTGKIEWRPGVTQAKTWAMELLAETPDGVVHERLVVKVSCDQGLRVCGCDSASGWLGLLGAAAVIARRRRGRSRG